MLEGATDRWKAEARGAVVRAALACAAALAGGVALAFLCAAGFVVVLDRYGLVQACLAGAAVFVVVGLVLLAVSAAAAGRSRRLAEDAARRRAAMEASASPLTDPRLILLAVQIAQTIGFRRILPLLALGGAAFAVATRSRAARRGGREDDTRAPL